MKYINPLIALFLPLASFGQLIIGGTNPIDFVTKTLSSDNVFVSNFNYNGYNGAICYFGATVPNMPFTSGILMTTGNVTNALGPNDVSNQSLENGYSGYSPLYSIGSTPTYDAAILSFDAVPYGDTLRIDYIFASEEYPEYVGSQFTDLVAIFISGPGIAGTQNIARLPNGDPIGVNFINNGNPGGGNGSGPSPAVNPQYYINNPTYSNPLQYDGLTVPLSARSAVIPNETYRIVIAIADGGDSSYDSGVFIKEGGITAGMNKNGLDNNVNIFYNSENQQATIEVKNHEDKLICSVTDLSGKVLQSTVVSETKTIDMSSYSPGMYVIRVEGGTGNVSKKMIR